MTKRLNRLISILTQLQSKRIVKAWEIADRFEISHRTIYRDINALIEAGVPIGSEPGVGYFLVDGYSLPPVSFTEAEANSLITAGKLLDPRGEISLSKNFNDALLKVRAVLRRPEKEGVEFLDGRISSSTLKISPLKNGYLEEIQSAITHNRVLELMYHSIYKNEKSTRKIEPLGLYFTDHNWILVAYCRLRRERREFRLDRIIRATVTSERFKQPEFTFSNYFEEQIKKSNPC